MSWIFASILRNRSILAYVFSKRLIPAKKYMLKVSNRNTRKRCEICSKTTIKRPERSHWRRSGVFIVNFKHISFLFLMFLLLTLNSLVFVVMWYLERIHNWKHSEHRVHVFVENFEHVFVYWSNIGCKVQLLLFLR